MSSVSPLRLAAAGTLALTVLLSGCSVLQIRTEDKDAGPVRVGVQKTPGPEPTDKPTDAGIPEGMSKKTISLGDSCPVTISFALGDDWTGGAEDTDKFRVFHRGSDSRDSDVILINCSEDFGGSAQAIIDSKRKYTFDGKGSQVLSETTGSLNAGEYWSFQGELGSSEILAINSQPTLMYGVQTGYTINGRLVNLSIEMRAVKEHAKADEDFKKMLPTVTIGGQKVPAPTFR